MVKKVVCIGALLLALPYAMRAQEVKTDTVRVAQLDKIISELGDSTDIVVLPKNVTNIVLLGSRGESRV